MSKWIGTCNQGFSNYAIEELRRVFNPMKVKQLIPDEVFMLDIELESDEVLSKLSQEELIFLRHIQSVDREFTSSGQAAEDIQQLEDMIRYIDSSVSGKAVSIHIRKSPNALFSYPIAEIKQKLEAVLLECGAEVVKQQPDIIISIFGHQDQIYVGFGTVQELRSDWPGGAIRFQREEGQISRAKFKLLEAEQAFGLDFSLFQNAIDIGAAPGGWTSLLLERGVHVTAIDPADMHPSLSQHEGFVHLKRNASEVKLAKNHFDLLVCDMSWSPLLMSKLVLDLSYALTSHAYGIVTVKLMHKKGMQSIREVREKLSGQFHILKAKQLFHNREEITLFIQKKK